MFVFVSLFQACGVVTIESIFIAMVLNLQEKVNITDLIAKETTAKVNKNDLASAKYTMLVYLVIFIGSQALQAIFSIQAVRPYSTLL